MGKLKSSYTVSEIKRLDIATKNGIRAAYYSLAKVKSDKNQIDKNIRAENLTTEQIVEMLKKTGCSITGQPDASKPSEPSKEEVLKKREATLENQENALKNREAKHIEQEKILKERETKCIEQEKELSEREKELIQKVRELSEKEKLVDEKEKSLNERIKLLSGGEKEFDERITTLLQNENFLNQKKAELDEKENTLRQRESILSSKETTQEKQSTEIQSSESVLVSYVSNDVSQSKENDFIDVEIIDSSNVTGIELCKSESRRILSDDVKRSLLIYAAGKEICNKWLKVKQETPDLEKAWTEKMIYEFVQDFVKSNFPYCGKAVYDLVLYDLQKRREEMNGVSSQD